VRLLVVRHGASVVHPNLYGHVIKRILHIFPSFPGCDGILQYTILGNTTGNIDVLVCDAKYKLLLGSLHDRPRQAIDIFEPNPIKVVRW
jgi:hypothetical protein